MRVSPKREEVMQTLKKNKESFIICALEQVRNTRIRRPRGKVKLGAIDWAWEMHATRLFR